MATTGLENWKSKGDQDQGEDSAFTSPNQAGGGQICPPVGKTLYISGTKSRIDLKPGCKFKFVVCL